jgi:hypothetical protein
VSPYFFARTASVGISALIDLYEILCKVAFGAPRRPRGQNERLLMKSERK